MQFTEEETAELVTALQAQVCQYARIENQYRTFHPGMMADPAKSALKNKADEYAAKRHALEALIHRIEYVGCVS